MRLRLSSRFFRFFSTLFLRRRPASSPTPLVALVRGVAAGLIGGAVQTGLLAAAQGSTRRPWPGAPSIPHPATANAAARCMLGAAWGGLYALWRESVRSPAPAMGAVLWLLGDRVLLPLARPTMEPRAAISSTDIGASVIYGISTSAAYAALEPLEPWSLLALPVIAAGPALHWLQRPADAEAWDPVVMAPWSSAWKPARLPGERRRAQRRAV